MSWFPKRIKGMTAKIEGTYGTDSVPVVGTDAMRVEELWSNVRIIENWPNKQPDAATGTVMPMKRGIPRGRYVEANISWICRGAGADAVIECDPVLRGAGWAQADGTLKFDYTLASTNHESFSAYYYTGDLLIKSLGTRASLRWQLLPGGIHRWNFLCRGRLGAEPATTTIPGGFGYDTTAALSGVGLTLSVGGVWTPALIAAEFDQGCEPLLSEDGNHTDGLGEFDWGEPEPFLTLTARKSPLATYDPYADAIAVTARAINATLGSVQFNRLKLSLPETCVETPAPADSQGFANHQLRYNITGSPPVITSD